MMLERDAILDGVRPFELSQLRQVATGMAAGADLARLEAKGWVETVAGVPLITLAGRTLLEHPPQRLG